MKDFSEGVQRFVPGHRRSRTGPSRYLPSNYWRESLCGATNYILFGLAGLMCPLGGMRLLHAGSVTTRLGTEYS